MKDKPLWLLDQVRNLIRVKHYSIRTEIPYISWIKQVHPRKLNEKDIQDFLTYLAVERRVSASTKNQAFSAILSLYKK